LRPEQAERLQALGYVTGYSKADPGADATGPDPKTEIEIANLMHEALLDAEEERYPEVVAKLEPVLKKLPNSALANLEMGRALKPPGQVCGSVAVAPESGRVESCVRQGSFRTWVGTGSDRRS
jgi:hypothetical protein